MNPKRTRIPTRTVILLILALSTAFLLAFFRQELRTEKVLEVDDARRRNFCNKQLHGNRIHDMTNILSLFEKPITLLDVGTNVGIVSLTTLYCLNVSHSTLSVEPVPVNARRFMKDVRLMGNALQEKRIAFRELAFSNVNKPMKIYVPPKRADNAALSKSASTANIGEQPVEALVVQLNEGDKVIDGMVQELKDQRKPQIVKIDTQGNEPRVLEGMKDFLTTHRDEGLLVFAEHDKRLLKNNGFAPFAVYDFMKGIGYGVYCKPEITVNKGGYGDLKVEGKQWKREYMKSKRCGDLIYWAGKKK